MGDIVAQPANNGIPGAITVPSGSGVTSIDDQGVARNPAGKNLGTVQTPNDAAGSDQTQPADPWGVVATAPSQAAASDPWSVVSTAPATAATPEKPGIIRRALESVGMTPEALEAQQQEMQAHPVKSVLENSMPAIGAAQGIYQWGKKRVENIRNEAKEAEEAVQNIREGGSVQDNIAKLAHGVLTGETSSVPFIGDPALTVGQDYHEGNYRGAVGGLVGILGQTVLPEIAPEAIAGVRGAFSPEYALKAATESHAATSITHQARTAEADVAARQAAQTTDVAERARQAEQAGTGTRDQTVQAENTASEAVANHNKAQKALAEASDAQKQSALDLKKANDRLVEKTTPKAQPDTTAPAIDKFKQAFQDARHPLADDQIKIALSHIAEDHAQTPITSASEMADALDRAEDRVDNNVKQAAEPHLDQPIASNPIEDITHALEPANKLESGWTSRGLASLEDFNLKDPTIGESMKLITRLNDQLRGIQKKNMWDLRTSLANSPEYAAKFALRDSLRDGVAEGLEDLGVKNTRQARSEQAAIINVRDAVDHKADRGSQSIRGTSDSTSRQRFVGKNAELGGKVGGGSVGAGIGYTVGGPIGGWVGERLGEHIGGGIGRAIGERVSPKDFTRDQIAANAADASGGLKTKLAEVSTAPARPLPVDDIPPAVSQALSPDEMRQLMREQTPIHAALASHYGESVADTSYRDLEDKFVNDIQDKKLHGIALEPDEKKLNAQLNEQHLADQDLLRTKAQQVAEQQETAPPEPTATLPRNAEPLLQGPKVHNGMGMREALTHDLVHAVVADQLLGDKLPSVGIRSHLHPENGGNHIASTAFDWSNFVDEDGNIDPDKISKNIDDIAAMYVSGGVANDLWHGVPLGENLHLGADIRSIEKLMNAVDIPKKRQAEIIAAAGSKVRDILEQPGFEQVIHDHASVREPNLDPTMHFSKDRIQQVIEDLKGGDNGDLEPTAGAGKSDRKSEEGPAGRSGKGTDKQAKAESKDQLAKDSSGSKEGSDENKASSSEVKSAKPALTRDEQVGEEFKQAFSHENLKDAVTKGYVDSAWDRIEQGKKVLFSDKPGSLESKIQSAVDSGKIKSKEDLQSFIKPENPKFSEPDLKYQHRENQMGGDATLEDNEGTKGYLAYVRDGDNAHVASSMILDDKLQGKGNGREMYERTAEALRDKGVKNFTSDTAVSPQATRVWESLEKKHPDEITRSIEDGKPKFTWKLNLDPDGDEFRAAVKPDNPKFGGAKEVKSSDEVLKNMSDSYGVNDNPELNDTSNAGFITPNARYINLPVEHDRAIEENGGPTGQDNHYDFVNNTGAIRVHKNGKTLVFSVPKYGVTPEQVEAMQRSFGKNGDRNGVLRIERADIKPETKNALAKEQEFPSVSNIKSMLQDIGASKLLKPENPKFDTAVAPPELTTGVPESDNAIKTGGGVPGGSMGGREGLAMFHSPETGSTLALKHADLTPERVKAHIEASNKLFKPENPNFDMPEKAEPGRVNEPVKPENPKFDKEEPRNDADAPIQTLKKGDISRDQINDGRWFLTKDGDWTGIPHSTDVEHSDIEAKSPKDKDSIRVARHDAYDLVGPPTVKQRAEIARIVGRDEMYWDLYPENGSSQPEHGNGSVGDFQRSVDKAYGLSSGRVNEPVKPENPKFDKAAKPTYREEVEVEPDENTGLPYGQHYISMHDAGGKEVGGVLVGYDGKGKASVNDSGIQSGIDQLNEKSPYRNKGYGKEMYEKAIAEAKKQGAEKITSGGATSPEAARVWRSLSKKYPIVETQRGDQPFFTLDFNPNKVYTKDEMIKQGADGYLDSAVKTQIPLDKLEGLEPTPAMDGGYEKGTPITQPVEVRKEGDQYILYSGNHRVTQARINGDATIPAFVEGATKADLANWADALKGKK